MDSLMDADCKPYLGSTQPAIGTEGLLASQGVTTRKSKKDKGGALMRAVVADNLKFHMEAYFADKPQVKNRPLFLATKAELGLGTVQRTLSCETGASIDTIEAIAKVFGIPPYEFLIPSSTVQRLMAAPSGDAAEELQRPSNRRTTRQPPT